MATNAAATCVRLCTIGHSNHSTEQLVRLLRAAGVTAVADVRSQPFSQRLPHFSRPQLELDLARGGIGYLFLGDVLGGRPSADVLYDEQGRVDYERVRGTEPFRRGLERLLAESGMAVVAMLCAEEDPLDCHRGLMITPALAERGVLPLHLRGDGSTETTPVMEARLLAETKVGEGLLDGLFAAMLSDEDRRELLAEAYRVMGRRRAFQRRADPDGAEKFGENW